VTGGDLFDLQIAATMQANGSAASIRSTPPTSLFSEFSVVVPWHGELGL
jgi:hypothetical protein